MSKEKENLLTLLYDLFGSEAIVYLPESDQYLRLVPLYESQMELTIHAVQLNMTPMDEDFYSGELYSCVPDKEEYLSGEAIRITVTDRNPNPTTIRSRFRLDMQADGEWYAINRMYSWGHKSIYDDEITYAINSYTLYRINHLVFDPETGLFDAPGDRDYSLLQLPEGNYRFSTWVTDTISGEDYQLMCKFQVTGG